MCFADCILGLCFTERETVPNMDCCPVSDPLVEPVACGGYQLGAGDIGLLIPVVLSLVGVLFTFIYLGDKYFAFPLSQFLP